MSNTGLRFALFTTFYPPYHFGGDANYVRQLAHVLVKRGHEVDIIHDIDAYQLLSDNPNPAPLEEPKGITVYGLRSRIGGISCFLTQQLGYPIVHRKEIKNLLKTRNHDVIHFHNASLVSGLGGLAYGDAVKLYTAHEHWLVCPTHVLWRHNREVCTEKQCLRCVINYKRPPQIWRKTGLLKRKGKSIDQFCSPSHFSAAKHKSYGFPFEMQVLPSFIPDMDELQTSGENTKPYFLIVGRLEKIKGIQDVIPLFSDDINAELWIAGTGDYGTHLKNLAKGKKNIKFLGQVPLQTLRPLYANAIAAIMPSICYEVFPLVVLEAFREKTPIIVRQLGPYTEIVEHSKGGLLFNSDESFKDAIQKLTNSDSLRQELGRNGFQAYQETWSEHASMSEYFKLIRKFAKQRNKHHTMEILNNCSPDGYVSK